MSVIFGTLYLCRFDVFVKIVEIMILGKSDHIDEVGAKKI